jgi:hypothetical protein
MQEQSIDNSSYRLIFYLDKKDEIYHNIAQKSILKLVKLQNFEYFSITRCKNNHFRLKNGYFYRT